MEDAISDESYNGHEHDGIVSRAVQYLFHQVRGCCVWVHGCRCGCGRVCSTQ
jgi:hypothetical protein